jgi:hypothetical protein
MGALRNYLSPSGAVSQDVTNRRGAFGEPTATLPEGITDLYRR